MLSIINVCRLIGDGEMHIERKAGFSVIESIRTEKFFMSRSY